MSDLIPFTYGDHELRVVTRDGEPWFVGNDACDVLGLTNTRQAIARVKALAPQAVCQADVLSPQGTIQKTNVVSEAGLYLLVGRSSKPEAIAFQLWVVEEVLPSLRKTGTYTMPGAQPERSGSELDIASAVREGVRQAIERADRHYDHLDGRLDKITRWGSAEHHARLILEGRVDAIAAELAAFRAGPQRARQALDSALASEAIEPPKVGNTKIVFLGNDERMTGYQWCYEEGHWNHRTQKPTIDTGTLGHFAADKARSAKPRVPARPVQVPSGDYVHSWPRWVWEAAYEMYGYGGSA